MGLPKRTIYEYAKTDPKRHLYEKEYESVVIPSSIPGLNLSVRVTLQMSGAIPATPEEVADCLAQVSHFYDYSPEIDGHSTVTPVEGELEFPAEIAADAELKKLINSEPLEYQALVKELRSRIKDLLKRKEDAEKHLRALINAVYRYEMARAMELELEYKGTKFRVVGRNRILNNALNARLLKTPLTYQAVGYKLFPLFNKTDIKWITQYIGEPKAHAHPESLILDLKREGVVSHYKQMIKENPSHYLAHNRPNEIESAVIADICSYLMYHKSWYERYKSRNEFADTVSQYVEEALDITSGEFIVADLETTGLDSDSDEIIEIAALSCNSKGDVIGELSVLVKPSTPLTSEIVQLTGISDEMLTADGVSLVEAFNRLVHFADSKPIFFHNSNFDSAFLRAASNKTKIRLENPIYDTLTMARKVFPKLKSYRLSSLANALGLPEPKHRARDDAMCALGLLLSIRKSYAKT